MSSGRGCTDAPFSDTSSRPSTHLLVLCSCGRWWRWRLQLTCTRLPHLWATLTRNRIISITSRSGPTLSGRGPPRAPRSPRMVHVSPRARPLAPFSSPSLGKKSHRGALPWLGPVTGTCPHLGPRVAALHHNSQFSRESRGEGALLTSCPVRCTISPGPGERAPLVRRWEGRVERVERGDVRQGPMSPLLPRQGATLPA